MYSIRIKYLSSGEIKIILGIEKFTQVRLIYFKKNLKKALTKSNITYLFCHHKIMEEAVL
jgi:hypothetical protein